MDWCTSPIPEAIQTAKMKGTMFLVYIYGTDDQSEQMNSVWDSDRVTSWVKEAGCIAVRIQSSSEECKFFSQIYPVVCVPSTYCIGDGGIPLEVIGGHMTEEEFINKLKSAQQNHESRKEGKTATAGASSEEPMQVSESPPESVPGSSGATGSTGADLASGDKGENLSHTDKVERAKELIAQKQAEKAQKEFEKSREEEINRRKLGKDLHKLKQTQQEQEMKELKQQMKKDKEEERKAKEKIRAQIARDREERASRFQKEKQERDAAAGQAKKAKLVEVQKKAVAEEAKNLTKEERASRFQKEKQERDAAAEQAKKAKLVEEQKKTAAEEAKKSETARLQVRLPDGSSITQTFPSSDTLQSLYNVVTQRMGTTVTLSTTFPKRVFTEEDMNSSFSELQLAPSAVLIALPQGRSGRQAASMTTASPGLGSLVSMVFYPFVLIWGFLSSLFFGGGGNSSNQQQQQSSQGSAWSSSRSQRPNTAYQRRGEGNMRRMADMRDDDEDMSTYNGNSTQQL